ncbi:nucleotidyltransferase and HEPN domain-containing protein [Novosphingobium sp. P6W]|uniref:nucleotidyltransferase and HEPN domain-containing protein n=1 Tax=Novosphingobium sp. P6W TaxID=1609758 RepID=UPI0005C2F147|nr:nucleotidyltransferase and HEPN domain-containing protein [Novosphingobium sp. P6W]AXB76585.1 HEPN domain-containing protein [Novosphingobium sp. P6W]KIS30826.1 nucleotidyltransferase [Novosphingobium sp. P6W]
MRTNLEHLSAQKQRELDRVVQFIFEEFDDALALAKHEWKKRGRIDKIVLYGSYARGDWVDEPHTAKGYQSDFDILIIVNDKRLTDRVDYWLKLEDRFNRELAITHGLRTPVNFIVHSLQEVNDGLAHGRYFFIDLRRDGIALYQFDDSELHVAKPKTSEDALAMAKEYFQDWLPTAQSFSRNAGYAIRDGDLKLSAFLYHQATERLYHCVLLVSTFYTPHVHNIGFLRTQAERLDRRLVDVWPRERRVDQTAWERLKEAYVKARYSKHYEISAEQLDWLAKRVEELGAVVHTICTERLSALEAKVSSIN